MSVIDWRGRTWSRAEFDSTVASASSVGDAQALLDKRITTNFVGYITKKGGNMEESKPIEQEQDELITEPEPEVVIEIPKKPKATACARGCGYADIGGDGVCPLCGKWVQPGKEHFCSRFAWSVTADGAEQCKICGGKMQEYNFGAAFGAA